MFFNGKRHLNMDIRRNFLFPKIHFKRDIIRAKIWFPSGKCWLANNMTGQADVRLCKLGGGWWLVEWMYQVLFFSLSSQRSKEAKKKIITPDLRLGRTEGDSHIFFFTKKRQVIKTGYVSLSGLWCKMISEKCLSSFQTIIGIYCLANVFSSLWSQTRNFIKGWANYWPAENATLPSCLTSERTFFNTRNDQNSFELQSYAIFLMSLLESKTCFTVIFALYHMHSMKSTHLSCVNNKNTQNALWKELTVFLKRPSKMLQVSEPWQPRKKVFDRWLFSVSTQNCL